MEMGFINIRFDRYYHSDQIPSRYYAQSATLLYMYWSASYSMTLALHSICLVIGNLLLLPKDNLINVLAPTSNSTAYARLD